MAVRVEETRTPMETKRRRSERLEVRTTVEDRELINRAVAASETDLTDFVVSNLRVAAQRVLTQWPVAYPKYAKQP